MIKVIDLTKYYGDKKALDKVSFSIPNCQVVGLLGVNGAGKSTTMNLIAGCLFSDNGEVLIDDISMRDNPKQAKRLIGYLPETPPLYVNMTVIKYLEYVASLKGLKSFATITGICKKAGLESVMSRLIRNLSKGYRQRVGIAMAMIGDPPVIILDEPTVGLDPQQITEIRRLIRSLGKTKTIIISSHILSEVQVMAGRILMLEAGKLVVDISPEDLANLNNRYEIIVQGDLSEIKKVFSMVEGVSSVEKKEKLSNNTFKFIITVKPNCDPRRQLFFALAEAKLPILQISPLNESLEHLFFKKSLQKVVTT